MLNWQLSDFLVPYPSINTSGFQTLISAKKEFNELASDINEKKPNKGEPYKHQLLFRRYMSIYDEILIIDETGTGKSCELVFLTEYILDQHLNLNNINVSHIKRTIILVKSESLIKEFIKQLVCVCTKSRYNIFDKNVSQKKAIKNKLKEWYEFHTYETFAKKIKNDYENQLDKLSIDYDHSIIICDEAHNLFVDEDGAEHKETKEDSWNKEKTYHYLWYFYHNVKYCKKILSSATPMLNGIEEIGKIINLILPVDMQLPVSTSIKDAKQIEDFYKQATLEDLEPYFRGRITYVRAFDTGATRVDQINSKIKCPKCPKTYDLYYTRMSHFQSQIYQNVLNTKGGSSYSLFLNNASNFVFPDGSLDEPESQKAEKIPQSEVDDIKKQAMKNIVNYQTTTSSSTTSEEEKEEKEEKSKKTKIATGYSKYVIENKNKKQKEVKTTIKLEKKKSIVTYQINKEAKPALILNNIKDVEKYSCKYAAIINALLHDDGTSYIYGRYNTSSGNIMLSLCLEHAAGFERYMETNSVFIKNKTKTNIVNDNVFCGQQEEQTIRSDFVKKQRYALLTSDTIKNDAAFNSLIELLNSYENRHGEYLKCIIGSRVVRDGFTFKNIQSIHIVGPEYNTSSMYQAISRGIRTASHQDLLNELIQQKFDPKLDVKVYLHASLPGKDVNNLGVDVHIYQISYDKQTDIDSMMIKAKQCAIGCQIHYKRNVRPSDVNKYQCVDPIYNNIDYSTYNAYFLDDDINTLLPLISPIISSLNYFTIDDLTSQLDNFTPTLILTTLDYIILNKTLLVNLFGYSCYLYYNNGFYYLDKAYDVDASSSYIYYEQNLIGINNKLDDFINNINVVAVDQFVQLTNEKDIEDAFNKLSIDNQILFIEKQYIDKNIKYNFLLQKYIKLFYTVKQIVSEEVTIKETKRGRPSKTSQVCQTSVKRTNQDIVLNLLNLYKHTNKHNFISAFMDAKTTIRILNADNTWRLASECENTVYQDEIKNINNNHFVDLKLKFDNLFGIIIGDYTWIVYEAEPMLMTHVETKRIKRKESRGRDCTSYKVADLQNIAKKLKIKNADSYTREQLCPLIEDILIDTDRIF
jgi:hypothetical protein